MAKKISTTVKVWIFLIIILLVIVIGSRVIFYNESIIPRDKPSNIGQGNTTPELNISGSEGEGGEGEGLGQAENISDACMLLGCPQGTRYVGTKNTRKYHYCWCELAISSARSNLVCFNDAIEPVMRDYMPCGICRPPSVT